MANGNRAGEAPPDFLSYLTMNYPQTLVAITALVGVTILGALGKVDGNALSAIYAGVIGAVFGRSYTNGKGPNVS